MDAYMNVIIALGLSLGPVGREHAAERLEALADGAENRTNANFYRSVARSLREFTEAEEAA